MAGDREVSEELWWLCHLAIEGGDESVQQSIAELSREEVDALLAEAVLALVDEAHRADKEIERFQRRFAKQWARRP